MSDLYESSLGIRSNKSGMQKLWKGCAPREEGRLNGFRVTLTDGGWAPSEYGHDRHPFKKSGEKRRLEKVPKIFMHDLGQGRGVPHSEPTGPMVRCQSVQPRVWWSGRPD
eukprot:TRINITY_DN13575_c0_g1_i1.p1 TRINITY_DN13575_c0_g1~~TRINITY_DN13575_c0_g1_i1.p1  ORF type:complete len:110 (-),score=3.66 TRINITY_DN13575_c0_g1_i1:153-482(-)